MLKKPDLLILITIWEFLTVLIVVVGLVFMGIYAYPIAIELLWGVARVGMLFGLSVGTLILLLYCGTGLLGGIGLSTGKPWGRMLSIVHSVLSLILVPIGTIIGTLAIIYLTKPEVKEYFETYGKTQEIA